MRTQRFKPGMFPPFLLVTAFILLVGTTSIGQIVRKPAPKSPSTPKADSGPAAQASPIASFEGKLVSVFDPEHPDKGDYIPCQFTVEQLLLLRPKPEVPLISSYDEEQIKAAVLATGLSQSNTGVFSKGQEIAFADGLAQAPLEGLTMSQALTVVIDLLNRATLPSPTAQAAAAAASSGKQAMSAWVAKQLPGKPDVVNYFSSQITATRPLDILNQVHSLANRVIETAPGTTPNTSGQGSQPPNASPGKSGGESKPSTPPSISAADKPAITSVQEAVTEASQSLSEDSTTAKNAIIDSARGTISAFQRPNDVGCAMSILSWNSERYAFGQTLANEYIAVQLVVRNMNNQQEFLVHDAEFSVDTDLLGAHSRYSSGLDKLTVRQFMLSSRDYGRRNFLVNMAQGVGAILSATTPVFGGGLADASSVYNAGFLNALNTVWKDHNTEQLNLLNDVGFSASKTDRTVVPKTGTAMFVIFIPVKQFQTGWWTQECADVIVTSKVAAPDQKAPVCSPDAQGKGSSSCIEPQDAYKRLSKYASPRTGIDLEAARAICEKYYAGSPETKNASATNDNQDASQDQGSSEPPPPTNSSVKQGTTTINYIRSPRTVPFRNWSDTANAIFRELSFAVVAGTHIQEEQDTTPSITKLDCPAKPDGSINFSKVTNGAIVCDVTGQNLDKAAKIKLRNSQDQSDTRTADGTVTTSGDSKTAKASFALEQIGPLNQKAYKVFTVTKDGAENGGQVILHFDLQPILSSAPSGKDVPIPLDKLTAKGATNVSVTLNGYHLDKLESVHLGSSPTEVSAGDSISIDEAAKSDSATAATFEFSPADAAKIPAGDYTTNKAKLYVFLVSKDDPSKKLATSQILYATGNVKGGGTGGAGGTTDQLSISLPSTANAGSSATLKVTVKDSKGKPDTNFSGTIHLTSSDKQALIPPDYTFVTADAGAKALSITFKSKGKQTVTVSSTGIKAQSASTTVK